MKIAADSNILFVEEAFNGLGEIILYKTRIDDKSVLRYADALLCRSTMKINKELLEGTKIKFVATATSGTEHFDTEYLENKNIKYADAKGSNSNAVAEYVIAALLNLAVKHNIPLANKTMGIIGWGCVGKKVEKKAEALGLKIFVNDPPLEDSGADKKFYPIDDILKCDIITLHVPLNKSGKYKTLGFMDRKKFSMMNPLVFINASRGRAVDEDALIEALESGRIKHAVLDVWQNEPNISISAMNHIDLVTPHIAGHSYDGKALGTAMILNEFCSYYNISHKWNYIENLPRPDIREITAVMNETEESTIYNVVKKVYDIEEDDSDFRKIIEFDDKKKYFDSLRGNYRIRREFFNTTIISEDANLNKKFEILGFKVR